jgi:hypothetical protein
MTALFIVRAEVNDPGDREPFDRWYEQEHLPQAATAFQAVRAWRGWSELNPEIHSGGHRAPTGGDALITALAAATWSAPSRLSEGAAKFGGSCYGPPRSLRSS